MFEAGISTRSVKTSDSSAILPEKRREHGHEELGGEADPLGEKDGKLEAEMSLVE